MFEGRGPEPQARGGHVGDGGRGPGLGAAGDGVAHRDAIVLTGEPHEQLRQPVVGEVHGGFDDALHDRQGLPVHAIAAEPRRDEGVIMGPDGAHVIFLGASREADDGEL